eukprot:CAMPEP_0185262012 /NCGR_PEP_ID=MMETSP1359-20130426/10271_1 /TAXON_ID=552665 /ORGANISM="Bigelowiella longifila, Strain CCMP242" /LENGTH=211 /DNA_ID=CAMNT_0027848821 /DNA_START=54 /DNA_END=689 /DNA_ORIENTATION=-
MKGLAFQHVYSLPHSEKASDDGLRVDTESPQFPSIHKAVPILSDDGFVLAECHAILTYLAEKNNWYDLYPSDLKFRAKVNEYLHWHHRSVREATYAFFAPTVNPSGKQKNSPNPTKTMEALDMLESTIEAGTSGFVVDSEMPGPTLADISCYTEVGQLSPKYLDCLDFDQYPMIQRWMRKMERLEGYEESHDPLRKFCEVMTTKNGKNPFK